jgi:hypothetical protein
VEQRRSQWNLAVWNPEAERRRDMLLGVTSILARKAGPSAA